MSITADITTNIVFGITGGLLSLVGLIAIFITLNTQYNMEKAREVLWDLSQFGHESNLDKDNKKASRIAWLFTKYRQLIRLEMPIKISVYIGIAVLAFVALVWTMYVYYVSPSFRTVDDVWFNYCIIGISVFFLFLFIILLYSLLRISRFVNIPTETEMEKADTELTELIYVGEVAAQTFYLNFFKNELYIYHPIRFYGIEDIQVRGFLYLENGEKIKVSQIIPNPSSKILHREKLHAFHNEEIENLTSISLDLFYRLKDDSVVHVSYSSSLPDEIKNLSLRDKLFALEQNNIYTNTAEFYKPDTAKFIKETYYNDNLPF